MIALLSINNPVSAAVKSTQNSAIPTSPAPRSNAIAHYYGQIMSHDQLTAQRNIIGQYIHCVVRPNEPKSNVAHEDCYNTIHEADQQIKVYRPDLRIDEAVSVSSIKPQQSGCYTVKLYANSGYNGEFLSDTTCQTNNVIGKNMFSDFVDHSTCFRVYDGFYLSGNSAALCSTNFYYFFLVDSYKYLG